MKVTTEVKFITALRQSKCYRKFMERHFISLNLNNISKGDFSKVKTNLI